MCKCNNCGNGNCSRNPPCPPEGVTPHPHAELMMQYAQDATETDKPWERWENSDRTGTTWFPRWDHPSWYPSVKYRRKPRTININGYEVPEPMRNPPADGVAYYIPDILKEYPSSSVLWWFGNPTDKKRLSNGILHKTREAAELHAKALLSFTAKGVMYGNIYSYRGQQYR